MASWSPVHPGVSFGQAISTPRAIRRDWKAARREGVFRTPRGEIRDSRQNATRAPAASRIAHSTGWSRKNPLVMWVVPRFLQAGCRFSSRRGIRAPSGTWKGRELISIRQGADIDVVESPGAGVQIDPVTAHADAVGERFGGHVVSRQSLPAGFGPDVLLGHGELGQHPSRLADVRGLRQPIRGADPVVLIGRNGLGGELAADDPARRGPRRNRPAPRQQRSGRPQPLGADVTRLPGRGNSLRRPAARTDRTRIPRGIVGDSWRFEPLGKTSASDTMDSRLGSLTGPVGRRREWRNWQTRRT